VSSLDHIALKHPPQPPGVLCKSNFRAIMAAQSAHAPQIQWQGAANALQVPLPEKQAGVRSPSGDTRSTTEDISSSNSSSVSSLYLDDDSPFCVRSRSKAKLFLPCEDEAKVVDPLIELQKKQIEYWNRLVIRRSVALGARHVRTAEALMDLGNAQLSAKDYLSAIRSYNSALKVFQEKYGNLHLSVARALDKVGLATSMTHTNLDSALSSLTEALKIRCEMLGHDHIDSVDSLNNVAGVHLNRGEYTIAAHYYRVVIRYREHIFGRCHASVGVTAHTLACVLDDRLDQGTDARAYFNMARDIYGALGLAKSHYFVDSCARLKEQTNLFEI
jgi:tetratricopeptide (TPR) repeat protein